MIDTEKREKFMRRTHILGSNSNATSHIPIASGIRKGMIAPNPNTAFGIQRARHGEIASHFCESELNHIHVNPAVKGSKHAPYRANR
jgi:hypothetical protein